MGRNSNILLAMSLISSASALNDTMATNKTVLADEIHLHLETGVVQTASTYKVVDTYDSTNFFDDFTFFTQVDPTHGFVDYISYADATTANLAYYTSDQIFMGVDYTTPNITGRGRKSVRVSSNKAYNHGLFIADIAHMPGNECGIWPAYWMFGPNWPSSGEIDIIEGVSTQANDTITLHTSAGCSINIDGSQVGTTLASANCNTDNGNTGCAASTTLGQAYGDAFNRNGGGVYAMQWESTGLYTWFWEHDAVPADITRGSPDTTNWRTPVVAFNGASECDIDTYFGNMNIIFDITFCGDWAGSASSWTSTGCSALSSTCTEYVSANPYAFADAYWMISTLKVYQLS